MARPNAHGDNLRQLDKNIAVIQYPSLTQWLADRFAAAISALEPMVNVPPDFMPLPLFIPSIHFGTFSSPLLLKLSRGEGASAAQNLGAQILQTFAQHSNPEEFSPKLWMNPESWLYTDFGANNLAMFLQNFTTAEPTLLAVAPPKQVSEIRSPIISSDPVLFKLQYAHARCCSLLRLAHQEKFLPLNDLEHYFRGCGTALWQTDSGELRLQTKAEQALLLALLQFPQSLSPQKVAYGCCPLTVPGAETRVMWPLPPAHLRKQAMFWGQLFSNFYSDCRLFGDIQTHEPQLASARFALVLILKKVLAFLLEDILQMTAPLTL
jgi:DALR anticodon binding domain